MTRCKTYYALKIIFATFLLLILSNNLKSDDKKDLEEDYLSIDEDDLNIIDKE